MAIAFYIAHGTTWILRGVPGGLLWACHLGCLLVGIAVLAHLPKVNAVGVLWLALGNVLWGIDLAGGGEFISTSPLTHIGGLLVGIGYLGRAGFPKGSWLAALAGIAALHLLSGYVTPANENINVAFHVHGSMKNVFPEFWAFRLFILASSAVFFFAVEYAVRRFLIRPEKSGH